MNNQKILENKRRRTDGQTAMYCKCINFHGLQIFAEECENSTCEINF